VIVTLDETLAVMDVPDALTTADADVLARMLSDYEVRGRIAVQSLFPVGKKLPGANVHNGPMMYWDWCWARHTVPVVDPDMIWQLVLGDVAALIKEDVEKYRHLFTDSPEQKTILIDATPWDVSFIDGFMDKLHALVPTNTEVFVPGFSTTTADARIARDAMFLDVCSPYYRYEMKICGFPAMDVRGTKADWLKMADSCTRFAALFRSEVGHFAHLACLFKDAAHTMSGDQAKGFWGDFFGTKRCGSGGEQEVTGWVTSLFRNKPSLGFACNYPTGVAQVKFLNRPEDKNYVFKAGMLSSTRKPGPLPKYGILEPQWGYILYEDRGRQEFETRHPPAPEPMREMA
jgi:hypothetical protein